MTGWHQIKKCEIQEERKKEQRSKKKKNENSVESATGVLWVDQSLCDSQDRKGYARSLGSDEVSVENSLLILLEVSNNLELHSRRPTTHELT